MELMQISLFFFARTQTSTDYDECTTVKQSAFVESRRWNVHRNLCI